MTTTGPPLSAPRTTTTSVPHRAAPRRTTTTVAVASTLPSSTTTTTLAVAPTAAQPKETLDTCLGLAELNHLRVVAANQQWYEQQLSALAAHHLVPSPRYRALQIEQTQTQQEIDAQYTIDKANCYLS